MLADGALAAARARRALSALVPGAVAALLLATHLAYSGLGHDYPEWRSVSAHSRDFLARLREAATAAPPGTTIAVPGLPLGEAKPVGEVGMRSALGMSDYSVQAWAELALPSHPLRVVIAVPPQRTPPTPGIVTVDAIPLPGPLFPGEVRP
jgi:hypothetical protein